MKFKVSVNRFMKAIIAISIALSLAGFAHAEKPVKLLFTDQAFDGQWQRLVGERFVELVKEKSNGKIKIEQKLGGILGDYMVLAEQASIGAVDMVISCAPSDLDPDLDLMWIGFLEKSTEHAARLWKQDKKMFKLMSDIFAKNNLKLLHMSTDGWLGLLVRKNTGLLDKIDQLPGDAKGTKTRVPASKVYQSRMSSYGFNAIPIPFSECYTGLQLGTFDIKACSVTDELKPFGDVIDGMLHTQEGLDRVAIYMNLKKFNSMPKELQDILEEVGRISQEESFAKVDAFNKKQNQKAIEKFGIKVKTLSPEALATLYEHGQKSEWAVAEEMFGKEKMDIIRAALAETPN